MPAVDGADIAQPGGAHLAGMGYIPWTNQVLPLEIDPITWALHVIESDHHEIHEGYSFHACHSNTTASTDAHRTGILLTTPAAGSGYRYVHMFTRVAASHAATFGVYEAPTVAANVGTHTRTPYNRNRPAANTSLVLNNATTPAAGYVTTLTEAQIAADGTYAAGTALCLFPVPAGDGPKSVGGESRSIAEWILKPATKYLFLVANVGANANTHHVMLDWYEHETLSH